MGFGLQIQEQTYCQEMGLISSTPPKSPVRSTPLGADAIARILSAQLHWRDR